MDKVLWVIATILVIFCLFMAIYTSIHSDETVEKYCSVVYQHSVTDYKACTKLSEEELIKKLTSDFNKNNEVPTLEIIK